MAAEGGHIDFMFLGPPLTRPLDPLLVLQRFPSSERKLLYDHTPCLCMFERRCRFTAQICHICLIFCHLQRIPSNQLCLFPIEPCFNQRIVPIPSVQGLTVWQKHKLHCMNIIRNICWWQLLNKCVDFITLHMENRKQLWFPFDNDLNVSL